MVKDIPDEELFHLISKARAGDEAALGVILDQHRDQLRRLAEKELNEKLSARVDASDIVQQTFLSACKKVDQFKGESLHEFVAWIYEIHRHNILDVAREHAGAEKRDVNREQTVNFSGISHDQSTPSQKVMQNEQTQRLSTLLEQLPEDQREAVRLRHLEGKSLEEMAEHFGRSAQAVASLLKRGLENLRQASSTD